MKAAVSESILKVLAASVTPMTAVELRRGLETRGQRVTKSEVNAALYGDRRFTKVSDGPPPRWVASSDSVPPSDGRRSGGRRGGHNRSGRDEVRLTLPLWPWQQDALSRWRAAGRRGVVQAVTGTGKSVVGLDAIAEATRRGEGAVVIVPTVPLVRQWVADLAKRLPSLRVTELRSRHDSGVDGFDVIVSTVQTASRRDLLGRTARRFLVVADECHRYGSRTFAACLDDRYVARLGLTATYERNDDGLERWLTPFFGGVVADCDYERALAEDVVARFRVATVGVDFSAQEKAVYDSADRAARDSRRILFASGIKAEPFGEFMLEVQRLAKAEPAHRGGPIPRKRLVFAARRYLSAFSTRRDALANTAAKLDVLDRIAPVISASSGTLVFSETVRAAEEAASRLTAWGIDAAALHSRQGHAEREDLLKRFGARQVAAIAAPKVLDEGIDVPAADLGVILAGSRSKRQMIQRMGRILRKKPDGRQACFIIAYVRGTGEDPARGAHEGFLDMVTEFADGVLDVEPEADLEPLFRFLAGQEAPPRGSQQAPPTDASVAEASRWRKRTAGGGNVGGASDPPKTASKGHVPSTASQRTIPVSLSTPRLGPELLHLEYEWHKGWLTEVELEAFKRAAPRWGEPLNVAVRKMLREDPTELFGTAPSESAVTRYLRDALSVSVGDACCSFLARTRDLTAWDVAPRPDQRRAAAKTVRDLDHLIAECQRVRRELLDPFRSKAATPTVIEIQTLASIDLTEVGNAQRYELPAELYPAVVGPRGDLYRETVVTGPTLLSLVRQAQERRDAIANWHRLGYYARRLADGLTLSLEPRPRAATTEPRLLHRPPVSAKWARQVRFGGSPDGDTRRPAASNEHVLSEIEETWRES